jgi:hypothetical protein
MSCFSILCNYILYILSILIKIKDKIIKILTFFSSRPMINASDHLRIIVQKKFDLNIIKYCVNIFEIIIIIIM